MRSTRARAVGAAVALGACIALGGAIWGAGGAPEPPAARPGPPDLSGYWQLDSGVAPDPLLMGKLPAEAVVLEDTGVSELPAGDFGGLKVKPQALARARAWRPEHEMTISKACSPPSIIYAMQGPFPLEIHQGRDLIVFRLEYYDLVRVIFMDGRPAPPPEAPHSKMGYSRGHWQGETLVVETTHLAPATITNNGLEHSSSVRVLERFRLSADGKRLLSTQHFTDPEVLETPGARFIAWQRVPGEYVYPYECDPSFAGHYAD